MTDWKQIGKRARDKGKALQKRVAWMISQAIGLPVSDVRSCVGGKKEEDVELSQEALRRYPYHTECKNQKNLALPQWLRQAQQECGGLVPTVVFKQHGSSRLWIVLPLEHWLEKITAESVAGGGIPEQDT